MLLTINHTSSHPTDPDSPFSVRYIRLSPRPDVVQTVQDWAIHSTGRMSAWHDGFGNLVHCLIHDDPEAPLVLQVEGHVETKETHGVIPYDDKNDLPPEFYLQSTPLTAIDNDVRDFARQFTPFRAKRNMLGGLHAVMGGIHDRLYHGVPPSQSASSPSQCLAAGCGTPYDLTHLFIACCHAWGVPARCVSGFVHSEYHDDYAPTLHAWAEALIDHLGWVSFDPTNCQSATQAYVRLAIAPDYSGAAPVRSLRQTLGDQHRLRQEQHQNSANQ